MTGLFRDYFSLNRKRVRKDFLTVYAGALLLEAGLLLRTHPNFSSALLIRSLLVATATFPVAAALVWLFHGIAAWSIVCLLARHTGMSMRDYLTSPQYQQQGKSKLQRGPGRKFFVKK